jgi:hypothetical protein
MTCAGCSNPSGGLYLIGCRGCTLRSLARSPEHFEARKAGHLTARYTALCRSLGEPKSVHVEVKAMAATLGTP